MCIVGDRDLKPFVSAEPDVFGPIARRELELLIVACDGVWDVMSNRDAANHVLAACGVAAPVETPTRPKSELNTAAPTPPPPPPTPHCVRLAPHHAATRLRDAALRAGR